MAIRFRCAGCGQPIEVDDEHANRSATCPYCNQAVPVPAASTYDPATAAPTAAPTARPAFAPGLEGAAAAPTPEALWAAAERARRRRSAAVWGNIALVCAGVAVLLTVIMYIQIEMNPDLKTTFRRFQQLSPEESVKLQQQIARDFPGLIACSCAFPVFVFLGLAIGIVCLVRARAANWRGIVAISACTLLLLLTCAGFSAGLAASS
ncbi:MAG: hypothetical protein AB1716_22385 [Planctomycetota bacterium]